MRAGLTAWRARAEGGHTQFGGGTGGRPATGKVRYPVRAKQFKLLVATAVAGAAIPLAMTVGGCNKGGDGAAKACDEAVWAMVQRYVEKAK